MSLKAYFWGEVKKKPMKKKWDRVISQGHWERRGRGERERESQHFNYKAVTPATDFHIISTMVENKRKLTDKKKRKRKKNRKSFDSIQQPF